MNHANNWTRLSPALLLLIVVLYACKNDSKNENLWSGSGVETYLFEQGDSLRSLRLFYFVPRNANVSTPIVFVFHGADRNGMQYRNSLTSMASDFNFIVVAPEFSESEFPGARRFQLGNVFENGESPTPSTLLPPDAWTFSVFPSVFDFVKQRVISSVAEFHAIGHSAGAQFLHRMLMFIPELPLAKAVLSASGWYTLPTDQIDFPYGLGLTPVGNARQQAFLSKQIVVQVGSKDNDPNAPFLRRNARADAQGIHRVERAQFYFDFCQNRALELQQTFSWKYHIIDGLDHSFSPSIRAAAGELFER